MNKELSIIIPCKNEGKLIQKTVQEIITSSIGHEIEIIVVDDLSTDGCCVFLEEGKFSVPVTKVDSRGIGAAAARNLGATLAKGNLLIFCDAHIIPYGNWLSLLSDALGLEKVAAVSPGIGAVGNPAAVGYGQTWGSKLETVWLRKKTTGLTQIPFAPGGCVAVKKEIFQEVGGFDRGFKIWGWEDIEFSLKLWLFGYEVYIEPQARVDHYFRSTHPYRVTNVEFDYNCLRMAVSHFSHARLTKVISMLGKYQDVPRVIADLLCSDSYLQRLDYFKRRKFDDDWFMQKFAIEF